MGDAKCWVTAGMGAHSTQCALLLPTLEVELTFRMRLQLHVRRDHFSVRLRRRCIRRACGLRTSQRRRLEQLGTGANGAGRSSERSRGESVRLGTLFDNAIVDREEEATHASPLRIVASECGWREADSADPSSMRRARIDITMRKIFVRDSRLSSSRRRNETLLPYDTARPLLSPCPLVRQ